MIHRIRDRASFERLARDGTRIRRRSLWCTWCPDPDLTAICVAYSFGRAFGPAVRRTTMRRRVRAILHEFDLHDSLPSGLLLIGGPPTAIELTFDQLTTELDALITQIRSSSPARST